jgi:hypothetical protein
MTPLAQSSVLLPGDIHQLALLQRQQFLHPVAQNRPLATPVLNPHSTLGRPNNPADYFQEPAKMPLLLLMHGADTLVFIDPSPEAIRASYPLFPSRVPHRVHSEKLLATESPFFKQLFSPEEQARVQKRRGLTGKLPAGFKYVLDLTPPLVDDDAIIVLTELCCPMGIRTWASKEEIWDLPQSCVGGQDEMEFGSFTPESTGPGPGSGGAHSPSKTSGPHETHSTKTSPSKATKGDTCSIEEQLKESKLTALPMEYSAQRHREGIEHVLHVLEGLSPTLDTPCKLWTFFGVAKLFGVATYPIISGHIISWFYELNNTRFIEIHPEVVYRVACGIKSVSLCREAFVELVTDTALLYLLDTAGFRPVESTQLLVRSPFSDVLDDTEVQRIEYASRSFGDFILRCFATLAGREMKWMRHLPDYKKLVSHYQQYPEDREFVVLATKILKEFVRDRIYEALVNGRDSNRSFMAAPSGEKFANLYYRFIKNDAPDIKFILQRLIGRNFWSTLTWLDFDRDSTVRGSSHSTIAEIGNDSSVFDNEQSAVIRHVSNQELTEVCQVFNKVAIMRHRIREEEEVEAARLAGEKRVMQMTINVRPSQSTAKNDTQSNDRLVLDPTPAPTPNPSIVSAAPISPSPNILDHIFSMEDFKKDVRSFVATYSEEMLKMPESNTIRHDVSDLLSCLKPNEYQYLPLWADGNDDGTGGVFTDHIIPAMEAGGFSAPGPAVQTDSIASASNSVIELNYSDAQSINAASRHATQSHVSDLMSIASTQCGRIMAIARSDEAQWQTSMESIQYNPCDDEASLSLGLTTDDEELENKSDCVLVDMQTPSVSELSEDTQMDDVSNEAMDTDFELIEFCD